MIRLEASVSGKVQGVHYRTYTQDTATNLGLVGEVRNLSTGKVQVVAEGAPEVLKEFVECLHEGSLLAVVESVSVDWGSATRVFDEFSIKA